MSRNLDQRVRERARERCEYCHLPQSASKLQFVLDHIVARQHRGKTQFDNLALCCGWCNRHKGPNLAGVDPVSKRKTFLFSPRSQRWSDHFRWRGPILAGTSQAGRATVEVLAMNHASQVAIRRELIQDGASLD